MDPDGPDFDADPIRCRACEARDMARRKWTEDGGDPAGIYFAVTRNDDVDPEEVDLSG